MVKEKKTLALPKSRSLLIRISPFRNHQGTAMRDSVLMTDTKRVLLYAKDMGLACTDKKGKRERATVDGGEGWMCDCSEECGSESIYFMWKSLGEMVDLWLEIHFDWKGDSVYGA